MTQPGIAEVLKRTTLAWATEHDIAEISTWTQTGNENVRAVNERLGRINASVSIRVEASLR